MIIVDRTSPDPAEHPVEPLPGAFHQRISRLHCHHPLARTSCPKKFSDRNSVKRFKMRSGSNPN